MTKSTPKKSAPKKTIAKKSTPKKAAKPKPPQPKTKKAPVVTAKKIVKKPVAKKLVRKKAVTTATKAAPKKTKLIKKATATKTSTVSKKQALPKTAAKLSKKPVTKKIQSIKPSKDDLRKTIANLESRMKRADTLTRKSVKALESAVMTLDARTRKDNSTGKAALTRKVNQLSAKLTEMVEKTQAEVNSELKTVLNNPSLENLQAALFRADQRLSTAEQAQSAAISKVNRHLASIATAVEARIEEEAEARKVAIEHLQSEAQNKHDALTLRIDTIESDTARALAGTGDKITELTEEMSHRGKSSELSIREKVSEIALQTQTEFEAYRAGLERRIDNITQNQSGQDTQRLEKSIASLAARLEGLEHVVANTPQAVVPQNSFEPLEIAEPAAPQLSVVASQALPQASAPQALVPEPLLPDAFSPISQIAATPTAAPMPNPYLPEPAEPEPEPEPENTGPIESVSYTHLTLPTKA